MSMPDGSHFDRADRARLGRAIELGAADAQHAWTADEIAAIYRHELNAPLQVELSALDESVAAQVGQIALWSGLTSQTIGALLHHPQPPVELLVLLKDF